MLKTALILLAHGARDPEWALPLRRVSEAVVAQAPELRVELAFMELMPPNLGECAEKLMAEGYKRILVVPLFIAMTLSGLRTWNAPSSPARTRALTIWSLVQGFNALWLGLGA